jgi:tetratricopeptide (TPR) repeat protein
MATLFEKRSKALDTLDEWQELITHFEISGHTFAYFPVLVPDESWAEVCQNKLDRYLSAQDKKLHILSFDNAEDFKLLTNRIFEETFEPNTVAVWITTPIPFETELLDTWKQAWRESMARLNQFRNKLTKNYPYTFLFVGGTWTHEITFNIAPDLWSIHSGIIRINPPLIKTDDDNFRTLGTSRVENIVDENADANFALRQAKRLRGKKGTEAQYAELLVNAAKLLIDKGEYRKALEITKQVIYTYQHLIHFENRLELKSELAKAYIYKSTSLWRINKLNEAIVECDKAIKILKPLIDNGKVELSNYLAKAYVNKGNAIGDLGKIRGAIILFDEAIAICKDLVENGHSEFADELALAYMNKGVSLATLGTMNEAIVEYDKAITIWKTVVASGLSELSNRLAIVHMNKGISLAHLSKINQSIVELDKAIKIWKGLVENGHNEFANELAIGYMNKGVSFDDLGKINNAIIEYTKAIEILKPLIDNGRIEFANDLAKAYLNRGISLYNLGKIDEAIFEVDKSIIIRGRLVNKEGMYWLKKDLEWSLQQSIKITNKDK